MGALRAGDFYMGENSGGVLPLALARDFGFMAWLNFAGLLVSVDACWLANGGDMPLVGLVFMTIG